MLKVLFSHSDLTRSRPHPLNQQTHGGEPSQMLVRTCKNYWSLLFYDVLCIFIRDSCILWLHGQFLEYRLVSNSGMDAIGSLDNITYKVFQERQTTHIIIYHYSVTFLLVFRVLWTSCWECIMVAGWCTPRYWFCLSGLQPDISTDYLR